MLPESERDKLQQLRRELLSEGLSERCLDGGKRAFASKNEAEEFLRSGEIDATRDKVPQRAYRCEQCHKWHLTAKPFRPRR